MVAHTQPLISSVLGHALIATEDQANFQEAKQVLRSAVARDNTNPFAWYQLGIVYNREGDEPRAPLATAEPHHLEGNPILALAMARNALTGMKQGTPDCLRAQDIALASSAIIQQNKKRLSSDERRLLKGLPEAGDAPPLSMTCRGA